MAEGVCIAGPEWTADRRLPGGGEGAAVRQVQKKKNGEHSEVQVSREVRAARKAVRVIARGMCSRRVYSTSQKITE